MKYVKKIYPSQNNNPTGICHRSADLDVSQRSAKHRKDTPSEALSVIYISEALSSKDT